MTYSFKATNTIIKVSSNFEFIKPIYAFQWMMAIAASFILCFSSQSLANDDLFQSVLETAHHQNFPVLSLFDAEGEAVSFPFEHDKPILLNLWATWCAPCVKELPSLKAFGDSQDEIMIQTLNLDINMTPEEINAFLNKHEAGGLPVLYGKSTDLWKDLKINGLPVTYLIDENDIIRLAVQGDAEWADPKIYRFLLKTLEN